MWKLAGKIVCWWYSHDLDQLDSILGTWKLGFIFTRIKFEIAAKVLGLIGFIKNVSFKNDPETFVRKSLNCKMEEC